MVEISCLKNGLPWTLEKETAGLEHRIGGLEKENLTGNVSYDADNHQLMTDIRAAKVERIANDIPELEVFGDQDAELLVLGWGSTLGAITGALVESRKQGHKVARAHLRYINPFPRNLGEVLDRYRHVLIPEMNSGQLSLD